MCRLQNKWNRGITLSIISIIGLDAKVDNYPEYGHIVVLNILFILLTNAWIKNSMKKIDMVRLDYLDHCHLLYTQRKHTWGVE